MAIFAFLILLVSLVSVHAVSVEWSWSANDENVKYYRYQLNGEAPDKWTVVDASVTRVTLPIEDENAILYIQSSFNGEVWSESGTGEYTKSEEVLEDIGFVNLSWDNSNGYPYLRYQRDSEEGENWIVIDGNANSVVLPYHMGLNSYYLQSSYDSLLWSESGVAYYRYLPEPHLKVIIESLVFDEETDFKYSTLNVNSSSDPDYIPELTLSVKEHETDSSHLLYTWESSGYNWFKFRIDDEPWYLVDSHTEGALLKLFNDCDKEDSVFQIKGSVDGKKWTERLTINDKNNKYNEEYMDREGWVIDTSFSVYFPYLVAFFTPAKGTINYTTPRELTTEDVKVSFGSSLGASYETKGGNSYGFDVRFIYSPTEKVDPYTSTSLEFTYSRLLYRTPKYNTFQLWLATGLGPSLCLFRNVGSIGLSFTLGFEARFTFSNNLVLFASYDNTVIIEPNFNEKDQLTLGTTFYTTLPLKIGLSYSFKEVKD